MYLAAVASPAATAASSNGSRRWSRAARSAAARVMAHAEHHCSYLPEWSILAQSSRDKAGPKPITPTRPTILRVNFVGNPQRTGGAAS